MRILDKYLLRSLAIPLGCCLAAFTMVYVIFDLFNHMDEFIKGGVGLGQILEFYVWTIPPALIFICPISMLLAVLYCLLQLTKNSELTAMRACGVSLYRLTLPFLGVGFLLSVLTAVVNEKIAPQAAYRTHQFIRAQKVEDKRLARMAPNLAFRNEPQNRTWMIRHFDTQNHDLFDIEIVEFTPEGHDARKITARRGTWKDRRWWFSQVVIQEYDEYGSLRGVAQRERQMEMTNLTETPDDFLNVVKDPRYLSAKDMIRFRETHPSLSPDAIARLEVDYHNRLATPWMTLIVTLLGIPFGHQTARKGALVGILLAMALFFGFYILVHVG
ncbi:MAG: LptF/LptG family permease, partial [Kiritimatiellia bacterium]|nr:LptF/LptG family permease [Kiritimatiellia bacterium]